MSGSKSTEQPKDDFTSSSTPHHHTSTSSAPTPTPPSSHHPSGSKLRKAQYIKISDLAKTYHIDLSQLAELSSVAQRGSGAVSPTASIGLGSSHDVTAGDGEEEGLSGGVKAGSGNAGGSSQRTPPTNGYNMCVLVGDIKMIVDKQRVDRTRVRLAEVNVGDETGCISLRARDEQIDILSRLSVDEHTTTQTKKAGGCVVLRNCTVELYQNRHLRLAVTKWGTLKAYPDHVASTPSPPVTLNNSLNLSLADVADVVPAGTAVGMVPIPAVPVARVVEVGEEEEGCVVTESGVVKEESRSGEVSSNVGVAAAGGKVDKGDDRRGVSGAATGRSRSTGRQRQRQRHSHKTSQPKQGYPSQYTTYYDTAVDNSTTTANQGQDVMGYPYQHPQQSHVGYQQRGAPPHHSHYQPLSRQHHFPPHGLGDPAPYPSMPHQQQHLQHTQMYDLAMEQARQFDQYNQYLFYQSQQQQQHQAQAMQNHQRWYQQTPLPQHQQQEQQQHQGHLELSPSSNMDEGTANDNQSQQQQAGEQETTIELPSENISMPALSPPRNATTDQDHPPPVSSPSDDDVTSPPDNRTATIQGGPFNTLSLPPQQISGHMPSYPYLYHPMATKPVLYYTPEGQPYFSLVEPAAPSGPVAGGMMGRYVHDGRGEGGGSGSGGGGVGGEASVTPITVETNDQEETEGCGGGNSNTEQDQDQEERQRLKA